MSHFSGIQLQTKATSCIGAVCRLQPPRPCRHSQEQAAGRPELVPGLRGLGVWGCSIAFEALYSNVDPRFINPLPSIGIIKMILILQALKRKGLINPVYSVLFVSLECKSFQAGLRIQGSWDHIRVYVGFRVLGFRV